MGTVKVLLLVLLIHLISFVFPVESPQPESRPAQPARQEREVPFGWKTLQECLRQGNFIF